MTTTAHEDQFTVAPEPVRQPYDTASILRRNVADLELALRTQTERAEAAEAEMTKARKQKPIKYLYRVTDCFGHDVLRDDPKGATILETIPLFAAPVPTPVGMNRMQEYAEKWRHAANEWADTADSAYQWLRNIRDGFSTANDAIPNVVESMLHCRRVQTSLAPPPAVPNEIGLGKGEFVIWPVKIGVVHGLAFVKTKDPKAVGTFHAEPEDGQIELGAGDSVIHFGNAESAAVLADRLQHVISLMNPANATPVPAPAVSAANPVQWLEDEGDMILVPRGLLGAACSSIDKQRPAPKVLEAMRHYTMNAPQAPAAPLVDGSDEYYEYLGALVESHPAGVIRHNSASVHAPAVPELDPMTRLIVSDPKQLKPKKQEPAVPYGIDEEAANRIALAVYDCKNGINQEPLLYAINRILATEAHPLSAEGQRSLLQSTPQAPAVPDGWTEWNGGTEPPVLSGGQRNYEFLRRDGQLAAYVSCWQHGIEGTGKRDIVAYRRKPHALDDALLQSAEVTK